MKWVGFYTPFWNTYNQVEKYKGYGTDNFKKT